MTYKIQEFIEKYINQIEDNNWYNLYHAYIPYELSSKETGMFTYSMISCDINPLEYMDIVPPNYLYGYAGNTPLNIDIPNNIKQIGNKAFYDAENINYILIPESVKHISVDALPINKNVRIIIPYKSLSEFKEKVVLDIDIYSNDYNIVSSSTNEVLSSFIDHTHVQWEWEPTKSTHNALKSYVDGMFENIKKEYENNILKEKYEKEILSKWGSYNNVSWSDLSNIYTIPVEDEN